ncbi:sigma-54-dependent Fis family transcriptional regulator [Ancylomarina euxinus]|uniref:Sigma-54-dependent Fis family transcriptional regulator n=1 Tax=Ancylomarina euxinus TaxID=2283627 RepID=A0A425Y7W6_9BACT|nr:sigma-54 dependent transcriptional regulator [Ancylomarina euxinus]MCZ4693645.1 sigma-54 dependent transcriptional regulator [Ancylomarina euxinus]MUP13874.1 response regulator [Ancylomarina euxinus]RRG24497.1 sigma-54-dependent Fis family transcriptional regulator [Ancylomarina euxinus]
MKEAKILVVDDNKRILSALDLLLSNSCKKLKCIATPNILVSELKLDNYDVVLLDMNFKAGINTGNEGIYWLNQILEYNSGISVVMITAYGDVELAVKAVRSGAVDFVLKPWENEKMLATIQMAWRLSHSKREVKKLRLKENELISEINRTKNQLIGSSSAWKTVMDLVEKVAITKANILITGENGTGKELVARELHRLSNRGQKVMVTVDMGSIAETLFESELFGHKKGAFTDAHSDRMGKIEAANEGTLFLDEIGNLSLPMQAKLLSVLQNRSLTKLGENTPIDVDLRLICATNCKLNEMVNEGKFRQDLLYRMNTIQIELPPLRDRKTDIPELARYFTKLYADKYNKKGVSISSSAINKLQNYAWPGNIRELQHAIEKAVILSKNHEIGSNDFIFKINEFTKVEAYGGTLEDMEKKLIVAAIEKQIGNLSAVASQLGITRQTLYNKIKRYGI